MDNALLVRRREGLGDLPGNRERLVERNGSTRDALRQILALDAFEHRGRDTLRFLDTVYVRDVLGG